MVRCVYQVMICEVQITFWMCRGVNLSDDEQSSIIRGRQT
jgi:hypothetical protein